MTFSEDLRRLNPNALFKANQKRQTITPEELNRMKTDAQFVIDHYNPVASSDVFAQAQDILKLLSEFERVNRLGTEVREVNIIYADGTGVQLWPKKEGV